MGLFLALTIGFRPQRRLGAMVAHRSCKAGVAGSSPAVGSLIRLFGAQAFGSNW